MVVIPYGSDAFVYRRLASNDMLHVLLTDYHESSRQQNEIAKRLDFWMAKADVVVPGLIGPEGLGRWDVLIPNSSCIDLDDWKSDKISNFSNGSSGEIVIAHAPNHRSIPTARTSCASILWKMALLSVLGPSGACFSAVFYAKSGSPLLWPAKASRTFTINTNAQELFIHFILWHNCV